MVLHPFSRAGHSRGPDFNQAHYMEIVGTEEWPVLDSGLLKCASIFFCMVLGALFVLVSQKTTSGS